MARWAVCMSVTSDCIVVVGADDANANANANAIVLFNLGGSCFVTYHYSNSYCPFILPPPHGPHLPLLPDTHQFPFFIFFGLIFKPFFLCFYCQTLQFQFFKQPFSFFFLVLGITGLCCSALLFRTHVKKCSPCSLVV